MTFEVGDIVKVKGEVGALFRVTRIRPNGDVDCWGGTGGTLPFRQQSGHASVRTFVPERLTKVKS